MRTEKKELTVQIGKRLQTVRENSGYTQEAFAEKLFNRLRGLSMRRLYD